MNKRTMIRAGVTIAGAVALVLAGSMGHEQGAATIADAILVLLKAFAA